MPQCLSAYFSVRHIVLGPQLPVFAERNDVEVDVHLTGHDDLEQIAPGVDQVIVLFEVGIIPGIRELVLFRRAEIGRAGILSSSVWASTTFLWP